VVIIDDLNSPFRTGDRDEALVEETYGLATRAFDERKMLKKETLLRRLHLYREAEGSIADELNLYYVALTRAKYALHMLAKKPSVLQNVRYAHSFAEFTDFGVWQEYCKEEQLKETQKQERMALAFDPDETLAKEIMTAFTWEYAHTGYENLPVKSSATALMADGTHPLPTPTAETFENAGEPLDFSLFDGKVEEFPTTDKEIGIAYHAFLEFFNFSLLFGPSGEPIDKAKLKAIVAERLEAAKRENLVGAERLTAEKLEEILSNPVFYSLKGYELYKERQFLVSLPIKDTYAKKSGVDELLSAKADGEEMIFQGAIDLLAIGQDGNVRIIDYKYSRKNGETIAKHYQPQLDLYKLATAKILKIKSENIRCFIVNICRGYQVEVK
jgi:ATP-dependent exoDNAse (exonuclease V) beta subunit